MRGGKLGGLRLVEHGGKILQIAGLARRLDDPVHRAADQRDLAAMRFAPRGATVSSRATLEANAVTATRPFSVPISSIETFAHARFRARLARHQRVGGIADHRQHAFVAQLSERGGIGGLAQQRIGIDLPVAGVHDHAERRADRQRIRLGDRMGDGDEIDGERPELQRAAQRHVLDPHRSGKPRFGQLVFEQPRGERRRIDGHLQPRPEQRDGADMILMRMGQHDAQHVLALLRQIADVRHDQIDARRVGLRARTSRRNRPRSIAGVGRAEAIGVEIHADLARAAKRQENEFVILEHQSSGFLRVAGVDQDQAADGEIGIEMIDGRGRDGKEWRDRRWRSPSWACHIRP